MLTRVLIAKARRQPMLCHWLCDLERQQCKHSRRAQHQSINVIAEVRSSDVGQIVVRDTPPFDQFILTCVILRCSPNNLLVVLRINTENLEIPLLRRSLVAIVAVALTACAASTIDPQRKASIGSVYVEPVQLSKASVFGPNLSEANASSGKVPATVAEATSRLQEVVDTRTNLRELIESQAKQDLITKGYRVTDAASSASAKLKINVTTH
ncbi:hypothetical protein SAMN03159448_05447 [Sinorhizobium sp. NFACC03]|nr:hypothetical protein SAMN03159448_05447 [Sinorhizobium sp. NFACC03]